MQMSRTFCCYGMILTVGLSNLMPKTGNSTLCGCYRGDHKRLVKDNVVTGPLVKDNVVTGPLVKDNVVTGP